MFETITQPVTRAIAILMKLAVQTDNPRGMLKLLSAIRYLRPTNKEVSA